MAESSAEKTEDATPKRRREARKKGSVAKSVDLTNALAMLALIIAAPSAVSMMGTTFMNLVKAGYKQFPTELTINSMKPIMAQLLSAGAPPLAAIMGCAMTVGVAVNFAQVGFIVSGESMIPNFQKLNPIKGLKQMFSMSGSFNAVKAFAKAGLFGYLAYTTIVANWTKLGTLALVTPANSMATIGDLILQIAKKIAMTWVVIAAIDYFIQRKQLDKNLKMTKEEVKQEFKESESNPEMKGKRLQRMRKMIRSNTRKAVQTADVIVTNPTHYSVAIRYEKGKVAPTVVAKGKDYAAFKIREFAKEFEIPIVPNPPLARALYRQCEIGDYVPRELFQSVAEVLAYVYKTIKQVRIASK